MNKRFKVLLFIVVSFFATSFLAFSVPGINIERSVLGNGGMVELQNSSGWKISGLVGQVAIDKISASNRILYQGFWVPTDYATEVTDDFAISSIIANFPNPASTSTTFRFNLDESSYVTLKIYDMVGNLTKVLVDGIQPSGEHQIVWDLKSDNQMEVPSGSYYYELSITTGQIAGLNDAKAKVFRDIIVIIK